MTKDTIMKLWWSVGPSPDQTKAMTFEAGPYSLNQPTVELIKFALSVAEEVRKSAIDGATWTCSRCFAEHSTSVDRCPCAEPDLK